MLLNHWGWKVEGGREGDVWSQARCDIVRDAGEPLGLEGGGREGDVWSQDRCHIVRDAILL